MTAKRCLLPPSGQAATAAARTRATLPVLDTDRCVLRAACMDDFEAWAKVTKAAFGDTPEQAWDEFTNYSAGWVLHGHGLFTALRKSDNQILGFVLLGLEWGDDEPELGYMFDAAFHEQGYATEACSAVRDYGVHLLGSGAFVSYVKETNLRSNAMAARLGATRDHAAEAAFEHNNTIWRHGVSA